MEWREIKTDRKAKEAAKESGVVLERNADRTWVAAANGRVYWASRPVYAMREWLRWR